MTKEEIVKSLNMVSSAMAKHRRLAHWGNVESSERMRTLRARKRELEQMLMKC